jgi:glycine/D-amino acid oxidase-like deaminating enzyme
MTVNRRTFAKQLLAASAAPGFLGQTSSAPRAGSRGPYDVGVIGAGVFGSWIARELRRTGCRVVLLEAYGPGHTRSSSGGETRIIRSIYGANEIYSRWSLRSLDLWKALSERTGRAIFRPTGVLHLAGRDDAYERDSARVLESIGARLERLSLSDLERRFPQFGLDGVSGGLLDPDGGVLMARRGVQTVVEEAVGEGVEYLHGAVEPPKGKGTLSAIRTLDGREVAAGSFVFACGPWLPKLFPEAVGRLIQSLHAQVFFVGPPPGELRFSPPRMPAWTDNAPEGYGVPDIESHGVKVGIEPDEPPFDPDTGSRMVTSAGLDYARAYVARRFPALKDAPFIETRVCQYEATPNDDFLIDRHPTLANVWIAGGGSGHGFKHGPALGEYVARLVLEGGPVETRFTFAAIRRAAANAAAFA